MSERWRDTYDSWKLLTPEDEAEARISRSYRRKAFDPDYSYEDALERRAEDFATAADLESDWEEEYAQWIDEQRQREGWDWLEIAP